MSKEVRAILFTAEEVRSAVEIFLYKGADVRKPLRVERVEIELVKGDVHARAHIGRGADAKLTMLGPSQLMTAVLMFCRSRRIPLASRASKQLDVTSTCLMLTMSLNQGSTEPRIEGNAVDYSAALPASLTDQIDTLRNQAVVFAPLVNRNTA